MAETKIPFNKPTPVGDEASYIAAAIRSEHISGDGEFTLKCHGLLQQSLGVMKALLTTSCTHALEMSALLLNVKPDDEIIVPSFTFVSTVNAFVLRGARPVFIDIRPDTLNMNEELLEGLLTPRTKVILPVHYAGVGCEMEKIMELAASRPGIAVVEDNAHGLYGKYKGRYLGTFGAMATQSFHETKNFTCGEGGALLINDEQYIERAEIIREKGTDRSRFFRKLVDKYTWADVGSSYLPSDILSAFLCAQLEAREKIQARRKEIWEYYDEHLKSWASDKGVRLPIVPEHCEQAYHMFYLLLRDQRQREALIEHLDRRGILSVFHYLPLHLSKMGRKFYRKPPACPVTMNVSDRLLRLPFYYSLTGAEQEQVVAAIIEFDGDKSS